MKNELEMKIRCLKINIDGRKHTKFPFYTDNDDNNSNNGVTISYEDIIKIVRSLSGFGIDEVIITGGEPLKRVGVSYLIKEIKNTAGIRKVSLVTDGILLDRLFPELIDAGLDCIIVRLNTLKKDKYLMMTGVDEYGNVWRGITDTLESPIELKLDCIPIKSINEDELFDIAELCKNKSMKVRFINTDNSLDDKKIVCLDNNEVIRMFKNKWPSMILAPSYEGDNECAVYYRIHGFKGSIGFINRQLQTNAGQYNELSLSLEGIIKQCFWDVKETDLKKLIDEECADDVIKTAVVKNLICV